MILVRFWIKILVNSQAKQSIIWNPISAVCPKFQQLVLTPAGPTDRPPQGQASYANISCRVKSSTINCSLRFQGIAYTHNYSMALDAWQWMGLACPPHQESLQYQTKNEFFLKKLMTNSGFTSIPGTGFFLVTKVVSVILILAWRLKN